MPKLPPSVSESPPENIIPMCSFYLFSHFYSTINNSIQKSIWFLYILDSKPDLTFSYCTLSNYSSCSNHCHWIYNKARHFYMYEECQPHCITCFPNGIRLQYNSITYRQHTTFEKEFCFFILDASIIDIIDTLKYC